jgi:ABC-type sugar transport system substrate-binding protein
MSAKHARDAMIALVAIVVAALSIYSAFFAHRSRVNLDTYEILGAVAGEEAAKLLSGKGSVLLLARGSGDAANPSVEAELQACRDTLKKVPGISITVEKVEGSAMQMMATGGGLGAEELFKRLEDHPGLGAAVLFMGFPVLNDAELESLRKIGVKIVVAAAFQPRVDRLLEQHAAERVIVPKPDSAPAAGPPPKTLRERFDREYVILKAESLARP